MLKGTDPLPCVAIDHEVPREGSTGSLEPSDSPPNDTLPAFARHRSGPVVHKKGSKLDPLHLLDYSHVGTRCRSPSRVVAWT